ncbi:hypothetical protein DIRU0_D08394 [Diutina rugosa]
MCSKRRGETFGSTFRGIGLKMVYSSMAPPCDRVWCLGCFFTAMSYAPEVGPSGNRPLGGVTRGRVTAMRHSLPPSSFEDFGGAFTSASLHHPATDKLRRLWWFGRISSGCVGGQYTQPRYLALCRYGPTKWGWRQFLCTSFG